MTKYRKLPVIVDAEVYRVGLEDGFDTPPDPYPYSPSPQQRADLAEIYWVHPDKYITLRPFINTLEGKMYIREGDYIVTGVQGERYPCRPDIFQATYEVVNEEKPESERT